MKDDLRIIEEPAERIAYKVSELTRKIRKVLEQSIGYVWVEGEISNFTRHSSGHIYFTLKDEHAQLKCVIWRSVRLHFPYEDPDGMKVIAQGFITVYERGGLYQLNVESLRPLGMGELQIAFEKLKKKLLDEGLFDTSLKKAIPPYPRCIAIVTSPTGAAIKDMISVISRRYPLVSMILAPVRVQGEGAAREIASALEYLNRWGEPDVIIVGRGGGSLEDLWAFNEEITARAIYESRIPVVSAVGHEIDFTIADFSADLRAPTPSAAGELVVPDILELKGRVNGYARSLTAHSSRHLARSAQRLSALSSSYGLRRLEGRLREVMQYLDTLGRGMITNIEKKQSMHGSALCELAGKLNVLSPMNTLKRGYSITRKLPDGDIVRDSRQVKRGSSVGVMLAVGSLRCSVDEVETVGGGS